MGVIVDTSNGSVVNELLQKFAEMDTARADAIAASHVDCGECGI
jgi:hypothetical protein